MNETKQCNNGHFYREDLEKCPLCSDKDLQNTELDNSSEKVSLQEKRNITDKIKLVLGKLKSWLKRNPRLILLILSFLFSLAAILEHLFLQRGGSADFIQFWEDISILTSICLSFLCLSSFTVLSFKSGHIYFNHLLFILSFLFSLASMFVILFGLAINQEPDILKQYLDFTLFICLLIVWLSSFVALSFKFFSSYHSYILLICSFLFPLFAIISFSSFPLLFACLSILCLSSFTILSFKSCHPYYPSILFVLSFLFYLFTIILIIFGLSINEQPIDFTLFGHSFHRESSSFSLIDLSFLTIGQSILYLIIGMVLKIKHNPPFFSFLKNKFFYIHFIVASIVTVLLFYFTIQLMDKYTGHAEEFELEDFHRLTIEEASIEIEQLGLKYQIANYIFTDSVPKGTIFTQNPISGTFVKEGRTIYFTMNRSYDKKLPIPNVIGKSKKEAVTQLGSNFNLIFFPEENNNSELTVNRLEYPLGNILKFEEDSLINGSKIYVYLELDKDDDKTNKKFEDSPQSTDSTTIE